MKEVCYFVAKDGKQFEEREECARHEFGLLLAEHGLADRLIFYTDSKQRLDIADDRDWEEVSCIIAKDDDALQEYREVVWDCGIDDNSRYYLPDVLVHHNEYFLSSGVWAYNFNLEVWENLNKKLEQVAAELEYWTD